MKRLQHQMTRSCDVGVVGPLVFVSTRGPSPKLNHCAYIFTNYFQPAT